MCCNLVASKMWFTCYEVVFCYCCGYSDGDRLCTEDSIPKGLWWEVACPKCRQHATRIYASNTIYRDRILKDVGTNMQVLRNKNEYSSTIPAHR